jgi:putative heme iron utilization protein
MLPVIAAQRLKLPEAVVTSALGAHRAVSAPGSAFAELWAVMAGWEQANFLIMKGANVFEILSGVSPGAPSETSQYFNIKYEHPLRGHLRPDLFGSIYAVALPGADDVVLRGVMFFDRDGALVFGTFISGEALTPSESDLARFNDIWELIEANPSVCAGS